MKQVCLFWVNKSLLRKKEKEYHTKLKNSVMEVEKNNPKKFWDIIQQLKEKDTCHPETSPTEINALINKYHCYYTKLHVSPDTQNSTAGATVFQSNSDNRLFGSDISVTLNSPFSESEIREGARMLKNGNAAGIDKTNEETVQPNPLSKEIPLGL